MTETIQGRAAAIEIKADDDGRPTFSVNLAFGDTYVFRTVTVTDPSTDLGELFRLIAARETGVTDIDRESGWIIYTDGQEGRRRIVAEWGTDTVSYDGEVGISFGMQLSDGTFSEIDGDDVSGLVVKAERFESGEHFIPPIPMR
jgi:hypothetical protein